ncbi:MAG TPA: GGDEF domain-containing phosphodiesterase [Gammaproteobacteria bacterium]|nr:GGDEF domain-containing phosphodiesterase [Gammaproteobacteria bacterium]
MAEAQEENGPGKKQDTRIRFIEQFLRQGQQGRLAGLVLGQLDAFNRIATTFGHEQCDAFCAAYTNRLREVLPPRTPILRLSERRFALLVDSDSMTAIMDVAVALTENNPPQLEVGGDHFVVDLTLGVAVYPSHADDASTLFRRAELALKEARDKELAFDIYRPDATQQQAALWKFETELQSAVSKGQLEVYYQPKVELGSQRVCGVEALVRWRTDSGNFVPASDFIPLAETNGAIVPLTWLVFDRIVTQLADWTAMPAWFSVAVNVSPQILAHAEFTTRVKALKSAADERKVKLTIELTEDSLVQGDASSLASIERLRKLGVDLAIDDFGKGYSSLTYLKQIPAAEIKIDKRFIGTVAVDKTDKQIVKTIIALAHALGMRVVAEGVDSAEAIAAVTELECDMAQGFFIGRPMRGDLVTEWMAHYAAGAMRRSAVVRRLPEKAEKVRRQ